MSLSETKQLLRIFRIVPKRHIGQNFLIAPSLYSKLAKYAELDKTDVVLDVGAGFGFLTQFLAEICKSVVAVEKDARVVEVLREQVKDFANVAVVEGDVLKVKLPQFNKVVSAPPYCMSSRLITWLLEKRPECVVLILQREFANKLVASVGSEEYSWLTVIASYKAQIELLEPVPKSMFYPPPNVDSAIIRLTRLKEPKFKLEDKEFFDCMVRRLFAQRNKKICNALVPFLRSVCRMSKHEADNLASMAPFCDRRARELSLIEFGELAIALSV